MEGRRWPDEVRRTEQGRKRGQSIPNGPRGFDFGCTGHTFAPVLNEHTDHRAWFQANRQHLTGGGLWLAGAEPNRLPASAWEERPFRVLITRLSSWQDTLESFTHSLIYRILAEVDGICPDMAWLPPARDAQLFEEAGIPWMVGGLHRDARAYDVLSLSNALVQELVNLPQMLEKSGIPVKLTERLEREDLPLVVMGGANALQSSAVWGPEAMIDVVFLGEEPETIQEFFGVVRDGKKNGLKKREIREKLREVAGVFLPDDAKPATRKFHKRTPDLNRFLPKAPIPVAAGVAGTGTVQVSEGCPWFCSFCAESWSRKPYREVPGEDVIQWARSLKRELGLSKLDLYSFNFNTYGPIRPLVAKLLEEFNSIGLKSQRFDALAHDRSFVELLRIAGKTSITCALEGISTRMRAFLQKDLSDKDLERSFDTLLRTRLRELKIFVIATGHENEEDLAEFKKTLLDLKQKLARAPTKPRIVVSATPLVRFPWTPLEFDAMPDPKTLSRSVGFIKNVAVQAGFEYRGAAETSEAWMSQVLVRARTPLVIEAARAACERTGFVFRLGVSDEFIEAFREELALREISEEELLRGIEPGEDVPWDALEPGVDRTFVVKQWFDCRQFLQIKVCMGLDGKNGQCHACGSCDKEERAFLLTHRDEAMPDLDKLAARIKAIRASEEILPLQVRLSEASFGMPMDVVHARLARAFMVSFPELTPFYRRTEPHGRAQDSDACMATGLEMLHPVFLPDGIDRVRQILSNPTELARVQAEFAPYGEIVSLEPVATESSRWSLRTPYRPQVGKYLASRGLKHILRREGDRQVFEMPKDSLKKRLVLALSQREEDGVFVIELEAGPKFELREFLKEAAAGESISDQFLLRVERLA